MLDELIEEEFRNRPADDSLAFLHFEKIYRAKLDAELNQLNSNNEDSYYNVYNHFMQTYINQVIATARALELDILEYWMNNPAAANNTKNFVQIKFDIDAAITTIKVRYSTADRRVSVRLEPQAREKIRDLISKIKLTIEDGDLPSTRKDALMNKLNAFSAEVDRDRTRFEAFGALVIEAAGTVGKAEAKLRPVRKWIDSIANLIRQARMSEDSALRLNAPMKRIAPPQNQIEPLGGLWKSPDEPNADSDNEVPF
ncbi:hypothetical protein [Acidisphaera rubrifaciens]|uniref:Uncharacterized protein n=1 Tax=Acidisphaera rubrifaciens HS-AP3 TaxID=1231350 RepID=A0A0D6P8S1_9PROT|nr:hypothetical protein [Acidisphaera rubrifaciens]GAN78082.1 hypothetical protein Asru_0610_06 [Acidisphaera rubrifaciens HS-AP3]